MPPRQLQGGVPLNDDYWNFLSIVEHTFPKDTRTRGLLADWLLAGGCSVIHPMFRVHTSLLGDKV